MKKKNMKHPLKDKLQVAIPITLNTGEKAWKFSDNVVIKDKDL